MTVPTPASPSALVVEQLDIRYRGGGPVVHAARGVDVQVGAGEVVALVGESGSGKSSICHAALGLVSDRATVRAQRIEVAGHDLTSASPRRWRGVRATDTAFVPQQPMTALAPTVAVGRQLEWHLGPGAVETHRQALLELSLDALVERPEGLPGTFSGGQLQRVVIAIATLGGSPSLLVADEPTSTLDATVAAAVVEVLLDRQQTLGAGLLYVSHDLATVGQVADRVLVVEDGAVVEHGSVAEVFGQPRHPCTRSLLDALPRRRRAASHQAVVEDPTPARLEVDHLYRYFGQQLGRERRGAPVVRAVDDVSLALPAGTVTALVGESGSGKSTLARAVAGWDPPTAGEVRLDAGVLAPERTEAQQRAIQLVSQNHRAALNHRRTVLHALDQVQRVHGIGRDRADRRSRAVALLERVGLTDEHLDRRPRQLSGGEAARVALARALLLGPEVLVLDEPTAGLDARVRAAVIDLLDALRRELRLTVLLITHELPVAEALADHVVVMHDGTVQEQGPADQVLHAPQAEYTRALLASVPPDPRRPAARGRSAETTNGVPGGTPFGGSSSARRPRAT